MTNRAELMRDVRARRDLDNQAQVDAIIAEFNGDADAAAALARLAEEILYWRIRMRLIADVVAKVRSEEPFAVLGAGPHWHPGERKPGWWR